MYIDKATLTVTFRGQGQYIPTIQRSSNDPCDPGFGGRSDFEMGDQDFFGDEDLFSVGVLF